MPTWFFELWDSLFGPPPGPTRRIFRRRIRLSGEALRWWQDPARTEDERWSFAELLLELDADPIAHSQPILGLRLPPGLRWSTFAGRKMIFQLDLGGDTIKILTCG